MESIKKKEATKTLGKFYFLELFEKEYNNVKCKRKSNT